MKDLFSDLKQFTGSETVYRHPLFRKFVYTEGVQYLAEQAGAYWLLDYIFSNQIDRKILTHPFQVWIIKIRLDKSAVICVEDGNDNLIKRFKLEHTDFPLQNFSLWLVGDTLLLPSEY